MDRRIGNNQILSVDAAGGSSFTAVGCIRNAFSVDATRADVDVTCLGDEYDQFVAGSKAGGNLNLEILYDPNDGTSQTVADLYESGAVATWQITYSTETGGSDTQVFAGYVNNLALNVPRNDGVAMQVGVKVTGAPGFEESSS
ncbi:phage tail tube protein [Aeoliella sp.]|uniref:phage tail tube protein n=1 Tax=Aeoliella sp. TaxID=2795800 RepID=UPI003CCBE9D7